MNRKIKKSTIKLLVVELLLIVLFTLNNFVLNIKNLYIISSFLLTMILVIILLLGFEKNKMRLRNDAILNVVAITIAFQILYYLSGLIVGFLNNGYSLKFINIIKNTLPVILIIISTELLRYSINQKGRESKLVLIVSGITFFVIDCSIGSIAYNLSNNKEIVEFICLIIFPSVLKNIFLTYNTKNFGYESSIIYRLIMELPMYLIPIVPNYNDYMSSIINIIFPIIIMIVNQKTLSLNNTYKEVEVRGRKSNIPLIITVIILMVFVSLSSGLFKYYLLAVGSGSMEKEFYRGDSVMVEKLNKKSIKNLKEGDIIVYKFQGKIIVHRIYKIENKNSDISITTKGDNNKNPDNWIVKEKNIIGKVKFKIKYIGYPTVLINDGFK